MKVCPYDYKDYTTALLGAILPHDDSVNDRSPGSRLCNAETTTRHLWRKHLGTEASFSKPGAMFRGLPPQGRLFPVESAFQESLMTGTASAVDLTRIRYSPQKSLKAHSHTYTLHVMATRTDLTQNLRRKQKTSLKILGKPTTSDTAMTVKFADADKLVGFPEGCDGEIEFKVMRKRTRGHKNLLSRLAAHIIADEDSEKCVGESTQALKVTDRNFGSGGEITLAHQLWGGRSEGHGVLRVTTSLSRAAKGGVCRRLSILPGSYYDCVMPASAESMWGPVPLPSTDAAEENVCKAVTHGILAASGQKLFSVYLIHSLALEMSVIQLFVGDKMAVVAHLVSQDTIGLQGIGRMDEGVRELRLVHIWPGKRSASVHFVLSGICSSGENHGELC